MFIWFCSNESFCCNSSLLEDMFATCCCRYTLVSVNYVKVYLSTTKASEKFATALLRFFSSATFPVKPCCWYVLDCISFWIIYSLLKHQRNLLNVFWISGRIIYSLCANWYFQMASIKVYAAFISCSSLNAVPPAIAKFWHSSIYLKMSAIGRSEAMGVVRRVVFTCNTDGIMCPYDWYKWINIYWSYLTPNPNIAEWIPAK